VATNLGVVFRGSYYHVLASYCEDSAVAHFGPGALHLRELLKYAIDRGLQRFDFTIGGERYKLEWCDSDLKLYDYAAAATKQRRSPDVSAATQFRCCRDRCMVPGVVEY
jgi:CelD/BcsL family acetyltransferase involved in cellulose biosynthesis